MKLRKLTTVAVTALVAATVATAALAAPEASTWPKPPKSLTGTWSGKTSQELVDSEKEWSQTISIAALNGRLLRLVVNVRAQCPVEGDVLGAKDIPIQLGWRVNRNGVSTGPRLTKNGGFALKVTELKNPFTGKTVRIGVVSITGTLGAGGASGRFDTSAGGCFGKGTWKAKRVLRS